MVREIQINKIVDTKKDFKLVPCYRHFVFVMLFKKQKQKQDHVDGLALLILGTCFSLFFKYSI